MHEPTQLFSRRFIIFGSIFFWLNIGLAYLLYPHWGAFSGLGTHWRSAVPYVLAMATSLAMLWVISKRLRAQPRFRVAGNALLFGATLVGLIVVVPFIGSSSQKAAHDTFAALFAFSVAFGVVRMAWVTRNLLLWTFGLIQFLVCVLELTFFARYNAHPVQSWVWTLLEIVFTLTFMLSLYILTHSFRKG